jgi:hypothetical protein
MNAQPSFDPPEYSPRRRISVTSQQSNQQQSGGTTQTTTVSSSRKRLRTRSHPAYAHRRQGLEATVKLVTCSALSVFGIVTLVNLIENNWSNQEKLHYLKTAVQDAKIRTEKVNTNFSRSFDPHAQQNMMEDHSYKIAPDRRQIVLVSPRVDTSTKENKK